MIVKLYRICPGGFKMTSDTSPTFCKAKAASSNAGSIISGVMKSKSPPFSAENVSSEFASARADRRLGVGPALLRRQREQHGLLHSVSDCGLNNPLLSRLRAPTCSDLPYLTRGAIADWEEEPFLRLRAPACSDLPYPAGRYRKLGSYAHVLFR